MINNAANEYKKRQTKHKIELAEKEKYHRNISHLRLLLVVTTITAASILYNHNYIEVIITAIFISGTIFLLLVRKHLLVEDKITRLKALIVINNNGISRAEGRWHSLPDSGSDFINEEHLFTSDLDIFGDSSLFQRINTAHTKFGREALAAKLSKPSQTFSSIYENQCAVLELAANLEFRQNLEQASSQVKSHNINQTIAWLGDKNTCLGLQQKKGLVRLLPIVSFGSSCAEFIFFQTFFIPVLFYALQTLVALKYHKQNQSLLTSFDNKKNSLKDYTGILRIIEEQRFTSQALRKLHKRMMSDRCTRPSVELATLNYLLNQASLRHNKLVHLFINILLLWDCRYTIKLMEWKARNGASIATWFEVIGEVEALASLSVLSYENPSWTMPTINNSNAIDAKNIKHPLLEAENNIGNDFSLGHNKDTAIISGSNMSGKSTFLRTVATNLVLAYAGAPVNADNFHCGQFTIVTSMRTVDNIDKKISTFYAELIRIKKMIDVAKTGNTFFFIDEIFSGTNSRDRLEGAFQVIKALNTPNCIGIVSTHDLALCELTTNNMFTAENYHFREHYQDAKIYFDYKIQPGHSTTSNALFMMQQLGIPVNQPEPIN
ncbi:MutS-related protein [Photobacterium alginatilyticum]|uniref:MutS-related protein n=1 Tax=Photobacterium alginatilyticum TaxID=1775171 RepID=UPI0040695A4A